MGWRDRDWARLTDDERQALWGTAGRRDRCVVCGRPVRGLPDARKEGKRWFCSTGHFLSYGGDFERGGSRGPLGKAWRVVKWTLAVFGVLFVALVVSALVWPVEDEQAASAKRSPAAAKLGKPVVLHGMRYRVTGARTAKRLYAREHPTKYDELRRPRGVYVVVNVAYKNVGNEPRSGLLEGFTLIGGNGKRYSLDVLSLGTGFFELQPEFGDRTRLVFDVRPAAVPDAKLEVEDCQLVDVFGQAQDCATARIDLGLR